MNRSKFINWFELERPLLSEERRIQEWATALEHVTPEGRTRIWINTEDLSRVSNIVIHTLRVTLSSKPNRIAGAKQIDEAKDSVRRSAVASTDAMFTSVGGGQSFEHSGCVKRALWQV